MSRPHSKAQQSEQTRGTLLQTSRNLFAEHGYGNVGLSHLVRTAGVTKGALYHHFSSKADLFRAVVEQVQQEVAARVMTEAEAETDSWSRLTVGCRAFLTAGSDPEIQQIMLIDAPAVLGWHEWRKMDEAASARYLAEALADLIDEGVLPPQPVAPLTHLLSGAMNEAVLWLARSTEPDDFANMADALLRLLESLRSAP